MVWTRLAGLIEKGWSPKEKSSDWTVYTERLAQMGPRWQIADADFYADPAVPWATTIAGLSGAQTKATGYEGAVATVAAPGLKAAALRPAVTSRSARRRILQRLARRLSRR